MFRNIRWRIAIPYVVLILLAMLGLSIYLSNLMREAHLAGLKTQLTAEARLLADSAAPLLSGGEGSDALDSLARRWADLLGARVTIIGVDGTVLGESHEDRAQMDNHLYRPEVQQALLKGQGSCIRFSRMMDYEMIYVAVPVTAEEQVTGIVRIALPLRQIEDPVGRLRQTVLEATLLMALLAALLALFIAERTARPVRQLTRVAERMAEGDLGARLFPTTRDEVGQLTHAFNRMADQLREKVTTLAGERSRLAAVLEYMADGVLIADDAGQVRLINPAAARLLDTDQTAALGRPFAQLVRHHQLIEIWHRCRERGEEQVEAVELGHQGLFLQVIVTPFQEADSRGYLVILQNLTRIRRLETVRRDFISNVSHELLTPLAALKALVDTLRDGALDDPPAAERFLNRVETEVDVMTQIVQELLELSRIESGRVPLRLIPTPVADVVLPPVERLQPQAERGGLTVVVDLPAGLPPVLADVERVQQVVANLVHNAVKFTPSAGQVTLSAEPVGQEMVISVRDTGVGIPTDDLPRIFERFYKADRARSGGGTGLGLAIARHIVQAHGGRIWAESTEGRGSTFYFSLPLAGEGDRKGC
jgi:two-component system phosphate regulon sensor histidine kinase PhoR